MIKDAVRFLSEVRLELSKVVWPKFEEFTGATLVVLALVTFFALYLFIVNRCLSTLVQYIFSLYIGQ